MTERELLETFQKEAQGRTQAIIDGVDRAAAEGGTDLEAVRREAHTLKGTAGVLGMRRLFELGSLIEGVVVESMAAGEMDGTSAAELRSAAEAFSAAATAAARDDPEPPEVEKAISSLQVRER